MPEGYDRPQTKYALEYPTPKLRPPGSWAAGPTWPCSIDSKVAAPLRPGSACRRPVSASFGCSLDRTGPRWQARAAWSAHRVFDLGALEAGGFFSTIYCSFPQAA